MPVLGLLGERPQINQPVAPEVLRLLSPAELLVTLAIASFPSPMLTIASPHHISACPSECTLSTS